MLPAVAPGQLWPMLRLALEGTAVAAFYGLLHDQCTYSLAPEYFTKLKFAQFHWADFGLPTRVFVAEVGVIGSWWVGFFAAWFMARLAVPAWPWHEAARRCRKGIAFILATALLGSITGFVLGQQSAWDERFWGDLCHVLSVKDRRGFAHVAWIHYGTYGGGLAGAVGAILRLKKSVATVAGNKRP